MELRVNNSPQTEPSTIIVSMALTTLAASYIRSTQATWEYILASTIFILSGTSTTQLYWSFIIPLLTDQLNISPSRGRRSDNYQLLERLVTFYFRVGARFLIAQCTAKEMRLLGYLNSLIAFLLLFLGEIFYIVTLSVRAFAHIFQQVL